MGTRGLLCGFQLKHGVDILYCSGMKELVKSVWAPFDHAVEEHGVRVVVFHVVFNALCCRMERKRGKNVPCRPQKHWPNLIAVLSLYCTLSIILQFSKQHCLV